MPLSATEYKRQFLSSTDALDIKKELEAMVASPDYNTRSSYVTFQLDDLPFTEKHLNYMSERPKLNHKHYLANLRLKTKIRR
jgi:hypothetical protein